MWDDDANQELIKNGVVHIESKGLRALEDYPFMKAVECLELNSHFKDRKLAYDGFDPTSSTFQALNPREQEWHRATKHCDNQKSTREDLSDLFMREVVGRQLESMKEYPLDAIEVFSLLSNFIGKTCLQAHRGEHLLEQFPTVPIHLTFNDSQP